MHTEVTVDPNGGIHKTTFPDSELAHKLLDDLTGIELGASSHNSFHLPGSLNVAPNEQIEFYRKSQTDTNGKYVQIDIYDDAETLSTFVDDSQGFILSAHVFEHLPNPIKALQTWHKKVKRGGYVYMTVPQRDVHPSDVGRALTTWSEWCEADSKGYTPATMPVERTAAAGGHRGHYYVYSSESLKELIALTGLPWMLVAEESPDLKVGNGFTLVYKVVKAANFTSI